MNRQTAQPPAAGGASSIRLAGPGDLPAIRELLSLRDGRAWDDPSTSWFVRGLDPEHSLAWLALVGDRPVGLSQMYLRNLRAPTFARRVGYWANLFVDPAYRDRMFYPRLPLTMFAECARRGISCIYASVRLPDLATAHTRIGLVKLGAIRVLAKPLRPARLLGKLFRQPVAKLASPPIDELWGAWIEMGRRRLPHDLAVEEIDPADPDADRVVSLLQESARERISDQWTPELFRTRYLQTREGTRYHVLVGRRGGELIGAVIVRMAERGEGILAGVVMDVLAAPGHERAAISVLDEAERRSHRAGGEVMIYLDGAGPTLSRAIRSAGYRRTSEAYQLMVWPQKVLDEQPELSDPANWRMVFGDHDAF